MIGSTLIGTTSLQATYLPDRHLFALWHWDRHRPGRAPGTTGTPEALPLVVPTGPGGALEVARVDCALVTPDELLTTEPGHEHAAASLREWQRVLRGERSHPALPLAAHAVPDATGTAVLSDSHALRVLRETTALRTRLTPRPDAIDASGPVLHAELRPYQVRGIGWLHETTSAFGGAILADDMGLGKTLQAIGFLLGRADTGPQLVICPTSLVANWAHEIRRFAPALTPLSWRHGELPALTSPGTVVIAGYPTLRLHGSRLAEIDWATAVFDEAQVLKNPRTRVSAAARALTARARVALTGTPVENHLEELWALLNLVTPALFTHRAQFRRRFVRPFAAGSPDAPARLRAAIEPVMLSRAKSQVAATLPAKIHVPLRCDLTEEQQRLYDRLLDKAADDGFGTGAQRNSRVLATLTALGQVCNHPGLVTGDLDELAGRSGKLDLCTDIMATNLDTGAPTLIFTQYRATGALLVRHLGEQFGLDVPFFHGGLDRSERGTLVRRFQSADGPPALVLSLRAAGTGLTLTRASEVIHFDRWWNPAVEAQASDRAHRIGQTRTVTVTTLTSATTVEEHVAEMHQRKSALTELRSGVAELARLDDEHLLAVLRRRREEY